MPPPHRPDHLRLLRACFVRSVASVVSVCLCVISACAVVYGAASGVQQKIRRRSFFKTHEQLRNWCLHFFDTSLHLCFVRERYQPHGPTAFGTWYQTWSSPRTKHCEGDYRYIRYLQWLHCADQKQVVRLCSSCTPTRIQLPSLPASPCSWNRRWCHLLLLLLPMIQMMPVLMMQQQQPTRRPVRRNRPQQHEQPPTPSWGRP